MVVLRGDVLRAGGALSCGCFRASHGQTGTPLYRQYRGMINRCYSKSNGAFRFYGAKGIGADPRWRGPHGFERFAADMGLRPSPAHTIERKDPAKDYGPENCHWLHSSMQPHNKVGTWRVTYAGETLAAKLMCDKYGIHYMTLRSRVLQRGWTVAAAIETPVTQLYRPATKRKRTPTGGD